MITWNPNDKSTLITLSNNNLVATKGNNTDVHSVRATEGKGSGKWYWEVTLNDVVGIYPNKRANIGVMGKTGDVNANMTLNGNGVCVYTGDGYFYTSHINGSGTPYMSQIINNDIIGILVNLEEDNNSLKFSKNGVLYNVMYDSLSNFDEIFPAISLGTNGAKLTANFGATFFDLARRNPQLWNQLLNEGYLPYDEVSSKSWLNNNDEIVYGKATVRNMQKYGVAWWKMNDSSGMVFDSKGNYHGANNNIQYLGGEGIRFNGTSSYIGTNNKPVPINSPFSIYFEIKLNNYPEVNEYRIIDQSGSSLVNGHYIQINQSGRIMTGFTRSISGQEFNILVSSFSLELNKIYKVLLTWENSLDSNSFKIFIDDFKIVNNSIIPTHLNNLGHSSKLTIGRNAYLQTTMRHFNGQLRNIQIYNKVIDPILNELIVESIYPTETFHQNQTPYIAIKGQINNLAEAERETGFRIKINETEFLNQEVVTDYNFNIQIPIENFNIGENILTVEADYTDEEPFEYVVYVEDKHNVQVVRRYDYPEKFSFDSSKSEILKLPTKFSENLIPVMTSNTAHSGVASSNGTSIQYHEPFRAFDKVSTTTAYGWATSMTTQGLPYLQYQFASKKKVNRISIQSRWDGNYVNQCIKSFNFLGKNIEDENWKLLKSAVNEPNWYVAETLVYDFYNENQYDMYRLHITEAYDVNVFISEFKMFEGYDGANLKENYLGKDTVITNNYSNVLTTGRRTIENVIIKGNEDNIEDLDYIQEMQNKQTLNDGYVWEYDFDLSMIINSIAVRKKVE